MADALIFPGQGAQSVGMASAFINGFKSGLDVVEEIESAISVNLSRLIAEGPLEELSRTENVQPAIFMVSMACVEILEKEYGYSVKKKCKYLAGHSLGEYTALCVTGAFSIADAARMVRKRGELMTTDGCCSEDGSFCMTALLGVCATDIENIVAPYASGDRICVIANDNSPSEVVISGHKEVVATVVDAVREATNMLKAVTLNTSGPFHSPLMAKATMEFDKYLSTNHSFSDISVPVIMNVDAKPLAQKERVHEYLVRQMVGRVMWREVSELLADDEEIDRIAEIPPGRILTKMMKRTYPDANLTALETVAQMEEFVKAK
jgi:[acyl-carrier-protein] S-malonyltransferase